MDEERLRKEEERLMRAMNRPVGGSRVAMPVKKAEPEPEKPAAKKDPNEEPAWKRKQREEREATARRLEQERKPAEQRKQQQAQKPAQAKAPQQQKPPVAAAAAAGGGASEVASQDDVMSYEEREKQRREEWKKKNNPYEWAMEDPENRLQELADLLEAKEREEAARAHGSMSELPVPTQAASVQAESKELAAAFGAFIGNARAVMDTLKSSDSQSFDFRSLAAVVRELQALVPKLTAEKPQLETQCQDFMGDKTKSLLLDAKAFKGDGSTGNLQKLVQSFEAWIAQIQNWRK